MAPRVHNPNVPNVKFVDITEAAGIRFRHTNGSFGKKLLPETLGSGCAFLDYDNDGRQDLLFVNSCCWPGFEEKDQPKPTMALYRNLGDGKFAEMTKAVGLDVSFYGMGAAVGDFDNDGWIDLFITGVGGCHLYHNQPDDKGGRRFVDVTELSPDLMRSWNWPSERGD
ncbi:MAG: VCBS repeat-containing protein, partial [Gemmataceae bacterium]|nr:VCBS repeat-containing protein [Gemmataceae bacterium]